MRCLACFAEDLAANATSCPHCSADLPALLHNVLPSGALLRNDSYRIEGVLGQGGFGITYLARHVALDQPVAIKEFYPRDTAYRSSGHTIAVATTQRDAFRRGVQRFLSEGRLLTQVHHANVVQVRDLFEEHGTAYLVMELAPGRSLRQELKVSPAGRLPQARAEQVLGQLVQALTAVHAAGVYHLDIKPENVLVGADGRVVLVDFGAARRGLGSGNTTTACTLEYAPPEVVAAGQVGPESDLFELAMLAHELLTGSRPPSALSRLVKDDWTPGDVPEAWRGRIAAALQLERSRRPASVGTWWTAAGGAAQHAEGTQLVPRPQFGARAVQPQQTEVFQRQGTAAAGAKMVAPPAPIGLPANPGPGGHFPRAQMSVASANPVTVAMAWCRRLPRAALIAIAVVVLCLPLAVVAAKQSGDDKPAANDQAAKAAASAAAQGQGANAGQAQAPKQLQGQSGQPGQGGQQPHQNQQNNQPATADVSGLYGGTLTQGAITWAFQLKLSQNGTSVEGESYIASDNSASPQTSAYMHLRGTVNGSTFTFTEDAIEQANPAGGWCLKSGVLQHGNGTLSGTWQGQCGSVHSGQISLQFMHK